MERRKALALLASAAALPLPARAQRTAKPALPANVAQLVVTIADSWSSSRGRMQYYSRKSAGDPWSPVLPAPVPVLLGRDGLAWGNGALPVPHGQPGVPSKREKDRKAPAGLFRIGTLYGYAAGPPEGCRLPYHQVRDGDCWIDDPAHPQYNRHLVVDPANPPPWYESQRMRPGDFAYEFLLEIRHNSDPPVAGHGSAIFFHIRRGPDRTTHGCTTMERASLVRLLRWLRPELHPHYLCLPAAEYRARLAAWNLPPPP